MNVSPIKLPKVVFVEYVTSSPSGSDDVNTIVAVSVSFIVTVGIRSSTGTLFVLPTSIIPISVSVKFPSETVNSIL